MEAARITGNAAAKRTPLGRAERLRLAGIGFFFLGLLLVASYLQPNRAGMGTHQQLGLPPCTFLAIFHLPCPSCGMTTSWSYFMNGDFPAAWSANAGGTCLAFMALMAAVWSLCVAASGRMFLAPRGDAALAVAIALIAVTLIDWVQRVF